MVDGYLVNSTNLLYFMVFFNDKSDVKRIIKCNTNDNYYQYYLEKDEIIQYDTLLSMMTIKLRGKYD